MRTCLRALCMCTCAGSVAAAVGIAPQQFCELTFLAASSDVGYAQANAPASVSLLCTSDGITPCDAASDVEPCPKLGISPELWSILLDTSSDSVNLNITGKCGCYAYHPTCSSK